jgi:hypothetical protein
MIAEVFEFAMELLTIFSPILIYWPQYKEMERTRSTGSFSILICFALLAACYLRIIYRYFH